MKTIELSEIVIENRQTEPPRDPRSPITGHHFRARGLHGRGVAHGTSRPTPIEALFELVGRIAQSLENNCPCGNGRAVNYCRGCRKRYCRRCCSVRSRCETCTVHKEDNVALTITESSNVNTLINWLLDQKSPSGHEITDREARAAAMVLAKSAYKKLWAGLDDKKVGELWKL